MAALDRGLATGCSLRPGAAGRGPEAALWPAAGPLLSRGGGPRASPCGRKRPPTEQAPEGCPASKRRPRGSWMLDGGGPGPSGPLCAAPGAPDGPCEAMEQAAAAAAGEQQCEAARRKLREIEARITDEDEDEDVLVEETAGTLPTLVLSDTLKTGLKRDYSGDLTKKIIESMSRPSMELVLWKPLPEFFTKKAKSVSVKNYKPVAGRCPAEPATPDAAFCLQTGQFSGLQETEMPSDFYSAVEPTECTEEEMEL
ncbi:coiled-coil domain-containing protein 117 [Eublepharis macularius]|uniref:Coiled-coil domain-containing protein 117 n=1 Tax=Eublepharis macularius TaxID=481883 RepID=A0AA97LEJ9_EUBMA|nr:coiled-coil domain-containing protein 117 [Eublepharis macularius]